MGTLDALAALIRRRNSIDDEIASLVGRPALPGHVGEYIAQELFGIKLHDRATTAGSDGRFVSGSLANRSVNVKWYGKHEGLLDLSLRSTPDYYLVFAGPKGAAVSSRGARRPWLIHRVFVFEARSLHGALQSRGVKLGVATSIRADLWNQAELYPTAACKLLCLSEPQRRALELFR